MDNICKLTFCLFSFDFGEIFNLLPSGSTSSTTATTRGRCRSETWPPRTAATTCARLRWDSRGVSPNSLLQVNTDPMISMTGHLDVVVPPTIIDEESSPSTVSVREKHNASLICKSHGVCSLPVSHQNKRTAHDLERTESKGVCTIRCLNQTSPGEERTVDRSSETPTRRSRGRWRALCTGGNTLICRLT